MKKHSQATDKKTGCEEADIDAQRLGKVDDLPPSPIYQMSPNYPQDLLDQGIEGDVLVEFIIDERGNVTTTNVMEATREEFGECAVQTIKKWKFNPGMRDGKPIKTKTMVRIPFVMEN